jgi:hypothetical protein
MLYIGLTWSHDLKHGFDWLTWINSSRSNMSSSLYIYKSECCLEFFYQTIFLPVIQVIFEFIKF